MDALASAPAPALVPAPASAPALALVSASAPALVSASAPALVSAAPAPPHDDDNNEEGICILCRERRELVENPACGHQFCATCIIQLDRCPMCRGELHLGELISVIPPPSCAFVEERMFGAPECEICKQSTSNVCICCVASIDCANYVVAPNRLNACNVVRLHPCAHTFHRHCAARWLKTRVSCPLCDINVTGKRVG